MKNYRGKVFFGMVLTMALPAGAAQVGSGSGVSGLRTHDHSSAAQGGATLGAHTVTGTVTSTKACASGYVRRAPNLCLKSGVTTGGTSLVRDTCTTPSVPPGATAVIILLSAAAKAANLGGVARSTSVAAYDGAGCLGIVYQVVSYAFEFVAAPAGTLLGANTALVVVHTANMSLFFSDDAGNSGSADFEIRGYFD